MAVKSHDQVNVVIELNLSDSVATSQRVVNLQTRTTSDLREEPPETRRQHQAPGDVMETSTQSTMMSDLSHSATEFSYRRSNIPVKPQRRWERWRNMSTSGPSLAADCLLNNKVLPIPNIADKLK